jgi:hypothetical protein
MMTFADNLIEIVPTAEAPRVALVLRCGPKGRNH